MKTIARKLDSRWEEHTLHSPVDQISLRYAVFRQDRQTPVKRYIVFFNGRTEWIEKNMHIPDLLNLDRETAFLTWDHRGQGASGGSRSHVSSYDDYVQDAKAIIDAVVGHHPYLIMAHSMGCLIACYGLVKQIFQPCCFVASSPFWGLGKQNVPPSVARIISSALKAIGLDRIHTGAGKYDNAKFADNKLTHDYDNYLLGRQTPYHIPSVSFGWVYASLEAIDSIFDPAAIKNIQCPVLILVPTHDLVVDIEAPFKWAAMAQQVIKDHEIKIVSIPGAKHELFLEIEEFRNKAIAEIKSFVATHCPDFLQ